MYAFFRLAFNQINESNMTGSDITQKMIRDTKHFVKIKIRPIIRVKRNIIIIVNLRLCTCWFYNVMACNGFIYLIKTFVKVCGRHGWVRVFGGGGVGGRD